MSSKKAKTDKIKEQKLKNEEKMYSKSVVNSFTEAMSSTPNEEFRQKCFDILQVHSSDGAGKKIGKLVGNFKAKKETNKKN